MFIATLIANGTLTAGDISEARDRLENAGCAPTAQAWIEEGYAADIGFGMSPDQARLAVEGVFAGTDVVVQPLVNRVKRLLVADMDSTMITVECIDELADYAGIKAEIAAVTERAMRGELDFASALDARVALLKDLSAQAIGQCLEERVRITDGAVTLIRTMRARGAHTVLVSGGFTHFAEPVGRAIGFDRMVANRLGIAEDKLTGLVEKPIVDSSTKLSVLEEERKARGLAIEQVLAVGDGANDLNMIRAAGLGVAYHAKPVVAAAAGARIDHTDLSALLYAQGIARKDWIEG
ncbi:phosphoserine phosphatase SerB [Stakelama sediminis]|uniref:Phosphoserine phosphatase n=1 Tax=Stakelama sediminis TaxID=463200 RepID=A0A840YUG7_9SPHN|nr:phosphoserine phosphatase SerB [Stakelama sediminis]MBB5717246.1 phosphoserine phosphatase [Stakelama sediminis]